MASVHEVIEAFRKAPSNSERGTKFEQLMVRYFQLDPMLAQQYDQVWRWIDWPGRDGKPDTGIDLVARERDTGAYTAIQCKFYEPTSTLSKGDIDSFFTASGKKPFTNRIIISTTDRWGKNAEAALEDQSIPVQRIGLAEIAESPIDWNIDDFTDGIPEVSLTEAVRHEPRPHQVEAIEKVFDGFAAGHERGKLVMACGTGKTFTALKIAERTAAEQGGSARILFAVPSISLLSQTLRGWTAQTQLDLRAFAVCSDSKVSRAAEDIAVHDVAIPVTTDPAVLAAEMEHRKRAKGLTVVFTTYQSLPVVAEAQKNGVDPFDLVICDEAHRTTGATAAGADESNFVRVHDGDYLKAARRLYMTATPRIFDEKVKDKADEHSAELYSMDDEALFGPEFHRLSFGEAVERGLLTDYKVIVLTVDESVMAGPLQDQLAGDHSELRLDDASRIIGCWNGLAKRAGQTPDGASFPPGEPPMRRAVAFAKDIAASMQLAEVFPAVVDSYRDLLDAGENDGHRIDATNRDLRCEVHHVDGTFNALERNKELAWLKAPVPDGECRILSNARCLSEGVDVPALDAVLFMHPRNSVVDVVQSVGRVMRLNPGKDYGYIILPVAVPAGVSPSQALSDNRRFKVVWQVLNALRAHDDRFNAMVNSLALNSGNDVVKTGQGTDRLLGGHIGPTTDGDGSFSDSDGSGGEAESGVADGPSGDGQFAQQMALFSLSEWQEAIYAKIVDKVGTRAYWEDWAADVADIAAAQITRIRALLAGANEEIREAFDQFLQGLRDNLNDSITEDDAISMLSQHLITKPVFDALFAGHDFASHNPVSRVMQAMVDRLGDSGLEAETHKLDSFYDSVRIRASEVTTAEGKQQVIAELYEKFFRLGFKKQSEALGIVYTPVEIVDFILRAADHASREAFGRGLTDEGVHILDPFTGTGTFLTRLLQSGLIRPEDLARKYANELHANEIMLLAYYIAAVNIETTYHALACKQAADEYEPFEGIVLADTFQITEDGDSFDAVMFPQNNDRIVRQLATPINVVIGNPPYSKGQNKANDNNAKLKYPTLDKKIDSTYAKRSTARLKTSLYNSYMRAYRWATDRVGESGVVAFVSAGGWLESNSADGVRFSFADEYSRIYVYNLRGSQRGDWKREGEKIFGDGSQSGITVFIGVKNPDHVGSCEILYYQVDDFLTRNEKLSAISKSGLNSTEWKIISPNSYGDWINHRSGEFLKWPTIGDKDGAVLSYFSTYSRGLATSRDAWCYNFSRRSVEDNMRDTIEYFNSEVVRFQELHPKGVSKESIDDYIDFSTTRFTWDAVNKKDLAIGKLGDYENGEIRVAQYRPFTKEFVYFDPSRQFNNSIYRLRELFPTPTHENLGIAVMAPRDAANFAVLAIKLMPDLAFYTYAAQFFPRWAYKYSESSDHQMELTVSEDGATDELGYTRIDNITDNIVDVYRNALGEAPTKDDIFYYVYGLLHTPSYRERHKSDLKKMLPHIPVPDSAERFFFIADAGRKLVDLHVNYESVEPYPLEVRLRDGVSSEDRETWRVSKPKWGRKKDPETGKKVDDRTTIIYNANVTISGIPEIADRYTLGSKTALGWVIDRYQVRTEKSSGIVNDPNHWCDENGDPTYIVNLIKRVTTVAVETMRIVDSLA